MISSSIPFMDSVRGGGDTDETTSNDDDDNNKIELEFDNDNIRPKLHIEFPDNNDDDDDRLLLGSFSTTAETKHVSSLSTTRALVLMDTFCEYHGEVLAHRAKTVYGVAIIRVYSNYMRGYFLQQQKGEQIDLINGGDGDDGDNGQQALHDLLVRCMPRTKEEAQEWCKDLLVGDQENDNNTNNNNRIELMGLVCDSDSGLADSELLSSWLPLTYDNGINEARRDKYQMNDVVGKAGIPVVQQRLCTTVEEALDFATRQGVTTATTTNATDGDTSTEEKRLVVVKPIRGCASDDVFLCRSSYEVRSAFQMIMGSTKFGSPTQKHNAVLVQEFAVGQEFAVDTVSKNGELKIAAIWIYDKRPANGAPFVYYATRLYDGEHSEALYEYLQRCLTALGIQYGITHSEIIMTSSGPRLVEVNCRQHNMDFLPLTMNGIGYNIYDMLLAAYLGDSSSVSSEEVWGGLEDQKLDWDLLPSYPTTRMNAAMVHLVNDKSGVLTKLNEDALREIQGMESTIDLEVYHSFLDIGNEITPTIDIKSDAGWVQLAHPDPQTFQRDYDRIIELMPTLFETES